MIVSSVVSLVAAIEALTLLGAFGALAGLYRRVRELEARVSATDAQMVAIAQEAQQMGAAVMTRLTEQRQALDASPAKPRRGRGAPARADNPVLPVTAAAPPRGPEPVAVLPVKTPPLGAMADAVLSDHDLARERGMDPLGVAIQRKLVGQAIRTA
jgi:hypothetical protein